MKKVLTTFETAKFLGVSPYTIRLWIIKGLLPAYSTPGGHRRIKVEELDDFLKKNRMPIPEKLFAGKWRALLAGFRGRREEVRRIKEGLKGFECSSSASDTETGFLLMKLTPGVVIADLDADACSWREIARMVRSNPEISHMHMIGFSWNVTRRLVSEAERAGFYNVLSKPADPAELKRIIREIFGTARL